MNSYEINGSAMEKDASQPNMPTLELVWHITKKGAWYVLCATWKPKDVT